VVRGSALQIGISTPRVNTITLHAMASPVVTPTAGVDPRVALATSMHAAPGVYAVLVGSGMSSAAGVPTGWQVVLDLIRRIATAEGVDLDASQRAPELWWSEQHGSEPRYDTLLAALAPTDAARRALLLKYFDPPPTEAKPIQPTSGHTALAQICVTGRIRLILTTNFDRLIERSLENSGVTPQVISNPSDVRGMIPLPHAPMTVVKLHGDYATLGLRNTPEELGAYPPEWQDLLARVFDEYGLLVVGWSAEYDVALSTALSSSPSRRYPAYWTTYKGSIAEPAARLIAQRQAAVIDTSGADDFFGDLVQRLMRLDQVAARHGRPIPLRTYYFPPEQTTAPTGWALLPLLQLRAVATVGPAPPDATAVVRPQHREGLINALSRADVTTQLRYLAAWPPMSASVEGPTPGGTTSASGLYNWEPTPGAFQTTENASYRLGGDGTVGISSIVAVRLPSIGARATNSAVFTLDIALSLAKAIRLADVAKLLRDALVLVTTGLPAALEDVLPGDADVTHAEIHILAATNDGRNQNRANDLLTRIDMSSLGQPSRTVGPLLGFAAQLSAGLTARDAAELVADAIEYVVLANGYLDPRIGISGLRYELGI
jgi:hypothetical protein